MAGYIGSKAAVVSSGVERKKTYAITTSTTSLTGLNYTVGKVHVFQNGVRLLDGTDYTATNGTSITLTVAAQSGDNVVVVSQASFQLSEHYTSAEADAEFVTKTGDTMSGDLSFGDNDKAIFGTGSDLQIYHDGSASRIHDNGTGNLILSATDFQMNNGANNETMFTAASGGAVTLKYSGNSKLATTSTGVDVTGTVTATADFKAHSSSSGDYVRMYGGSGTGKWDIYGNGANLRIGDNENAGAVQFDTNVGIGTSSPLSKLDVSNSFITVSKGSATTGRMGASDYIVGGTDNDFVIQSSGTGVTRFVQSSTERMRIDSSGRVGIGAVPTEQFSHSILQVGNQATLGANATMSSTGQTYLTHNLYYNTDGNARVFNTSTANEGSIYQQFDGNHVWSNSASTTSNPTITERMRITSSGLVGIGTASPQKKLEVRTGNGELSHFGSNSANAVDNYTGISLGYAENGNSSYRKVGIVSVGRGDGAARQDLAFLVDSNSDGGSAQLVDTKMRISHEGRVTMPSQPAFMARLDTSFTVGPNPTTLPAGTAVYNIGGHYSTGTYRFTAPVAGRYLFASNIQYQTNGGSHVNLYVNNSSSFAGQGWIDLGATTGVTQTMIHNLAAGDYVEAKIYHTSANTIVSTGRTKWMGYLIG